MLNAKFPIRKVKTKSASLRTRLLNAAYDPAPDALKLRIIEELGNAHDPAAGESLAYILHSSKRESLQVEAARRLRNYSEPPCVEALLSTLDSPSPVVKDAAIEALGEMHANEAVDALDNLLIQDDGELIPVLVKALTQIHDARSIPALVARLSKGSDAERMLLANAIASWEVWGIHALVEALDTQDGAAHRAIAAGFAALGPQALEQLTAALKVYSPRIRSGAAEALGQIGSEQALAALQEATQDADPQVAAAAVLALGQLHSPAALDTLRSLASGDSLTMRRVAAEALGELGLVQAVEPLITLLHDPIPSVRQQASASLARLGAPAVAPLVAQLSAEDFATRSQAAIALGWMGTPALETLLLKTRDPDARVRQAAVYGLAQVRYTPPNVPLPGYVSDITPIISVLLDRLADPDRDVRGYTVSALGLLPHVPANMDEVVASKLVPRLLDAADAGEARLTAVALMNYSSQVAVDGLLRAYESPESSVRLGAIRGTADIFGSINPFVATSHFPGMFVLSGLPMAGLSRPDPVDRIVSALSARTRDVDPQVLRAAVFALQQVWGALESLENYRRATSIARDSLAMIQQPRVTAQSRAADAVRGAIERGDVNFYDTEAAPVGAEAVRGVEEHYAISVTDVGEGGETQAVTTPPPHFSGGERYLNIRFADAAGLTLIDKDQPLVYNQTYKLRVGISVNRTGLGEDPTAFPDRSLDEVRQGEEPLPLLVMVNSSDFQVLTKPRTLQLPKQGDTQDVSVTVVPTLREGRGALQVSVLYRGYLLQSKRVEAVVIPAVGADVTEDAPMQTARVTFTTLQRFTQDDINRLPERVLTISIENNPTDGTVRFHVIDRTNGEKEISSTQSVLTADALGGLIDSMRKALELAVRGGTIQDPVTLQSTSQYGYVEDGADNNLLLNTWLPYIAYAGYQLYQQILPEDKRVPYKPRTVIQINPVLGLSTVPWALVYERPVKLVPTPPRVCENYAQIDDDDCAGCPFRSDPSVVCPHAFWGYRYALEQLPCWEGEKGTPPCALVWRVENSPKLNLNLNVYNQFLYWKQHQIKLEADGAQVLLAQMRGELDQVWKTHASELDLIYFYCHGGVDPATKLPFLGLSDGAYDEPSLRVELQGLQWPHQPLVLLNACSTGVYGPASYVSLIADFRSRGASGIIGTECPMPEKFAEDFASRLLARFFQQACLGQAMLDLRRECLVKDKNPLGLAYSFYAPYEIMLANPIVKS